MIREVGGSKVRLWVLVGAVMIYMVACTTAEAANSLGIPDTEYQALVALYNSTGGSGWTNKTNWLSQNTPWQGVTVFFGHVAVIFLKGNNLTGAIPAELGRLTNIFSLDLGGNKITGSIPAELGSLTNLQELDLSSNKLAGPIPPALGSLTKLQHLSLRWNLLTGSIPPELGNLASLYSLHLGSNQLTGPIPAALGNLSNLYTLNLNYNHLTGPIPAELGSMTHLFELNLHTNQLTGPIPAELGNLANLQQLYLSSNQFSGEVPSWIANLDYLVYVGLGCNAFVCSDPALRAFLTSMDPSWELSQTVPPADLSSRILSPGEVALSWTPIWHNPDQSGSDLGYYEIGYGSTSGGPYTFDPVNRTSSKYDSSLTISGIDLTKPVYFVARMVTLAGPSNQSTLTSVLSAESFLAGQPQDKRGADGSIITLPYVIVTAEYPGCFYVENRDRTWGVRVDGEAQGLTEVSVTGTLCTNDVGERCIQPSTVQQADRAHSPSSAAKTESTTLAGLEPLYMTNRTLGGGNWCYDPITGAGQCGTDGGVGLNNIGLLVKTSGKVVFAGRDWFYIDDGSGLDDGSGIRGLYVDAKGYPDIPNGAQVWVTGVSSMDRYNERIVNTLRAVDGGIISDVLAAQARTIRTAEPVNPRKH